MLHHRMHSNGHGMGEEGAAAFAPQPQVAVAIDRDKGSQNALKWTVDNIVSRGQTIMLVHVAHKPAPSPSGGHDERLAKEVFLPFRCFCTRKDVVCKDIILEDSDVAKALLEFIAQEAVEKMVLGYPSKHPFARFKATDLPSTVSKGAPDFCTVYVINKGKVSSVRQAVRHAPTVNHFRPPVHAQNSLKPEKVEPLFPAPRAEASKHHMEEMDSIRSPFTRAPRGVTSKSYGERAFPETDVSFTSTSRPSVDHLTASFYEHLDINAPSRSSNASESLDHSFELLRTHVHRSTDPGMLGREGDTSMFSLESSSSCSSLEDVEAEMRRLKLELKQTMDMYSTACKEALSAKQMARELHRWKMEEQQRLEEARLSEEAALALAEKEKAKCKVAMEAAEAAQRIAELEAMKRRTAEMKALKEAEEKKKALDALAHTDVRYRKYTIEEIEVATDFFADARKIGEGGYGPVYRCSLDHTPVAVKVLRPDAAQGRSQFQQEVEVLSCIRHPNMVLLLGACPEYGCLVYEYMENGSLEDRLFRRGGTPVLPWQLRFRIAADIGTGLLFLHQSKPEPLVHRDLKPANILLDRNYVSKISDVGLARLVPPNVADDVTQCRMTSAAGTFCYIDPEYQQTGLLGIKSDIYSLGILLLQVITARPPMGLTHLVERSIEKGMFEEMLDPAVPHWPVKEALGFAQMAIKCAELRRRDRPDLATVVLPELNRLKALANANMYRGVLGCTSTTPPPTPDNFSIQTSITNDTMSDMHRSFESSISRSSPLLSKRTSNA